MVACVTVSILVVVSHIYLCQKSNRRGHTKKLELKENFTNQIEYKFGWKYVAIPPKKAREEEAHNKWIGSMCNLNSYDPGYPHNYSVKSPRSGN